MGISVNFFHLDCLASEVRLNVDLDVALTVIAHGCYRWLATQLSGHREGQAEASCTGDLWQPAELWRSRATGLWFGSTNASHNPILREAALDRECPPVPWLGGLRVVFEYP